MEVVCEAMSDHAEGASSRLNQQDFFEMLRKVCKSLDADQEAVDQAERDLSEVALRQGGCLMASNLSGFD